MTRIAQQRGISLEQLLTDYADRAERTDFPGDPFHFFELSVAMICVADFQGNVLYANPTFHRVLGYEQGTLVSRPYKDFIHPDDIAATAAAEIKLRQGADITYFENRYRCQDGSYRWLSWASTVNTQYIYGVALDITEQKRIESQLEQTLEKNERILRTMFDGYLLGDVDGRILEVNSAYCEMIGYSQDELLQMKVFDLDPIVPDAQMIENARLIADEDMPVVLETRHKHRAGHLLDVEINNVRLEDGRIACFIRDISRRKRLEQQLRRSEQLYRGLVESQIDFVCRYTPDTVLTYVNDAYCAFFQRSRMDLIGSSFLALTPDVNHEPIFDRIREVQQNPAPNVRTFHTHDDQGRTLWIQWIDYGITDERGKVVEIQAVGRDVTALVETQQRLIEREEMLSTIFDNIPVLLSQFDQQGRFEYVNQHWVDVLGWTVREMLEHPDIMAVFYPDPDVRQQAVGFMVSGAAGWRDFRTRTRDGKMIDTSWANVRLSDGRTLGIGQVITHRVELENQRLYARQLETELQKERELHEMKDRFVSLIAHEFRTPLAVMASSIDLITYYHNRLSAERVHDKLTGIQQQIMRMVDLMEDTLRLSKASAGKIEFEPEGVEMLPFCRSIIDNLKLIDDGAHTIIVEGDQGMAQADPHLLDHILTNLLTNAMKYSPPASTITVTAARQRQHWQVGIRDEGIGIPEQDRPHVFDPFYRASNARTQPGTGLGLSIVRDYVELHGGSIDVESTLGQGTRFTFTLPAANG